MFYYHLRCLELILVSALTPVLLFVIFGALCEQVCLQHVWHIIWICPSLSEFMWISLQNMWHISLVFSDVIAY